MRVLVQPRAKQSGFAGTVGDHLKIRVAEPPVDGRATAAVRRLLADAFGVPQARVELLSGAGGRRKRWRIENPAKIPQEIRDYLD